MTRRERVAEALSEVDGTSLGADLAYVVRYGRGRYARGVWFWSWAEVAQGHGPDLSDPAWRAIGTDLLRLPAVVVALLRGFLAV